MGTAKRAWIRCKYGSIGSCMPTTLISASSSAPTCGCVVEGARLNNDHLKEHSTDPHRLYRPAHQHCGECNVKKGLASGARRDELLPHVSGLRRHNRGLNCCRHKNCRWQGDSRAMPRTSSAPASSHSYLQSIPSSSSRELQVTLPRGCFAVLLTRPGPRADSRREERRLATAAGWWRGAPLVTQSSNNSIL